MSTAQTMSERERMIQEQIIERGINEPRVIAALRSIDRQRFFPESQRERAYEDGATAIGHGQTISQPYMTALMTERLGVHPNHRVLEIGTGSGYQTALLALLAAEVWTIERVKPLLDDAFERLLGLGHRNVHFRLGDGTLGWPDQPPFDRVLISAAAPRLPRRLLLEALVDGGSAVLPVDTHEMGGGDGSGQVLLRVDRQGGRLLSTEICLCRFVPLLGHEGHAV